MKPGPEADRVLVAHMQDCLDRICDYTNAERARFDASRLVQDAVIRNPQTLAESSQRLSSEIRSTEPQMPWRELAAFRNVIVHGYLGVDLGAVWLVVEQDLPALTAAVNRMATRLGPQAGTGPAHATLVHYRHAGRGGRHHHRRAVPRRTLPCRDGPRRRLTDSPSARCG